MRYLFYLLKQIEDEEKEYVLKEVEKAKNDPEVPMEELLKHVYLNNDARTKYIYILDFIRGKLYEESHFPQGTRH